MPYIYILIAIYFFYLLFLLCAYIIGVWFCLRIYIFIDFHFLFFYYILATNVAPCIIIVILLLLFWSYAKEWIYHFYFSTLIYKQRMCLLCIMTGIFCDLISAILFLFPQRMYLHIFLFSLFFTSISSLLDYLVQRMRTDILLYFLLRTCDIAVKYCINKFRKKNGRWSSLPAMVEQKL